MPNTSGPQRKPSAGRSTATPTRARAASAGRDASAQLDAFLDQYTPDIAAQARVALRTMRARLPGAVELVYDNYNALAIGFGPSERTSEAIFSIALYPRWVSLFFLINGARLHDPDCYLEGAGNQVRHIKLECAASLDDPAVRELMAQALELSPKAIDPAQRRRLIIKSVSAKQRPRRPSAAES